MKISRLIELSEDEEKAFDVISKIECDCKICNLCPFNVEQPMGSDCLIDMVSNAYKGANI